MPFATALRRLGRSSFRRRPTYTTSQRLHEVDNVLALGPLGVVTPFPAKFKLRVLAPVHFGVAADQDRYSKSRIMEESEGIRTLLQESIYDMLRDRRSVWFG